MLPVMPEPLPMLSGMPPLPRGILPPLALSVGRGPFPSSMVASVGAVVGCVVGMVVGCVVGAVVACVVGAVVGAVVVTGLEFRQPQPTSAMTVRTRRGMSAWILFIFLTSKILGFGPIISRNEAITLEIFPGFRGWEKLTS